MSRFFVMFYRIQNKSAAWPLACKVFFRIIEGGFQVWVLLRV